MDKKDQATSDQQCFSCMVVFNTKDDILSDVVFNSWEQLTMLVATASQSCVVRCTVCLVTASQSGVVRCTVCLVTSCIDMTHVKVPDYRHHPLLSP